VGEGERVWGLFSLERIFYCEHLIDLKDAHKKYLIL
jgi:hypothetical protein